VAAKVLRILASSAVEVPEVVKNIQADPGLGAEVLTLANSPLFGFASSIRSVPHAIVVLGLERTKRLMMTVAMRAYLKTGLNTKPVQQCWHHSLACALLAEELAPLYAVAKDTAYTAGLMHDVGRAGLLAAYPKEYGPMFAGMHETVAGIMAEEKRLFDLDHCKAGLWLTRAWGFPEEFGSVSCRHHDESDARGLTSLVRLACVFADTLGFEAIPYRERPSLEDLFCMLPPELYGRLPCDFDGLQERIRKTIQSLG
jgi:putative nucleotidyltransferase with HDIG domain